MSLTNYAFAGGLPWTERQTCPIDVVVSYVAEISRKCGPTSRVYVITCCLLCLFACLAIFDVRYPDCIILIFSFKFAISSSYSFVEGSSISSFAPVF